MQGIIFFTNLIYFEFETRQLTNRGNCGQVRGLLEIWKKENHQRKEKWKNDVSDVSGGIIDFQTVVSAHLFPKLIFSIASTPGCRLTAIR